jgi:hypothetical protein
MTSIIKFGVICYVDDSGESQPNHDSDRVVVLVMDGLS